MGKKEISTTDKEIKTLIEGMPKNGKSQDPYMCGTCYSEDASYGFNGKWYCSVHYQTEWSQHEAVKNTVFPPDVIGSTRVIDSNSPSV